MSEELYNGIELPHEWPPRNVDDASYEPMPVPYLEEPPDVMPIEVGRQLFVDDFVVAETSMERVFHLAKKREGNPVMKADTPMEMGDGQPAAVPKDGGVWWDPQEGVFRMWYEAGWLGRHAYAVSEDGVNWERPELDVNPPTNQILPDLSGDSSTVFIDHDADDPGRRYKMFVREANNVVGAGEGPGNSMVSADGIHWSEPVKTGDVGDRTTMFYNPFRGKWVYSIRGGGRGIGRAREYREHEDFLEGARWSAEDKAFWCGADRLDPPDPRIGRPAQLYNLNAVAYESIMLGLFEIHLGPPNEECRAGGHPKTTELKTAFSRDGFHWHRPDRRAFIPASREAGRWDRGYVQPVGGICLIMGDELWFYYTGFMGHPEGDRPGDPASMYSNAATGIATLRRDGFASMRAGEEEATLLTRPVTFRDEHLFVNLDNPDGRMQVEVCSEQGEPIPGFTKGECRPLATDSTSEMVRWEGGRSLEGLTGRPVRFRFWLTGGDLYSFWTSGSARGESGGYVAAGGPGFGGPRDSLDGCDAE